jgi:hypothetical protein
MNLPDEQPDRFRVGGWVRDPDLARLMPDPQPVQPPQPQAATLTTTGATGAKRADPTGARHAAPAELEAPPPDEPPPADIDGLPHGDDGDDADAQRPPGTDRPSRRQWLILVAVLVLAGMAAAAGLLLFPPAPPRGDTSGIPGSDGPLGQPLPFGSGSPAIPVASAGPVHPSLSAPPARTPGASRSPAAPPFQPFEVEAEDGRNTLGGSAAIDSYAGASGGAIVYRIGDWGRGEPGTLTVPVAVPSAGSYRLSFSYLHPDGEATRSVYISISGGAPIVLSTTAGSDCCQTATVRVTLRAGANTISFGNPDDHAPAIDRITVTR